VASAPWRLELVRVGAVPPAVLRETAKRVEPLLGWPVHLTAAEVDGSPALDAGRRQYSAAKMLELLSALPADEGVKRVGVTPLDLFLPVFTHLYGYAQLGGQVAVVSTFRIRPEDGQPPELLLERTAKEVLHELGHTMGLVHCPAPWCAMHPSRWPEEIDLKDLAYCPPCAHVVVGH
jgi:archaemetzincin